MDKSLEPVLKTLLIADGRDKLMKTIQFVLKLCTWSLSFHVSKFGTDITSIVDRLVKTFSEARKIFRIANWLNAIVRLSNPPPVECNTTLLKVADRANNVCSFGSQIFDDAGWCVKMWTGIPISPLTKRFEKYTNILWTMSILIDLATTFPKLVKNYQEAKLKSSDELKTLMENRTMMWQNVVKLFGDLICASTTGFELKTPPLLIGVGGAVSGGLAYYRLYERAKEQIKCK